MTYRPTILLLVILAALGGYLYWVELPSQRQEEQQETASKTLLPFPDTAITGLSISTPQGIVEMSLLDGGRWAITAPLQVEADPREVQSLIRALVTGKVTRTVDDVGSALAPFGLDQPVTTITVKAGGQQDTISIGDSGPLSNTLYVLRGSDHKVLLTDLAPKSFVNKTLLTFRRKELLRFVQNDVERVRLTYPTTEIVLYNMAKDKPKPSWKIRYPIEAEADQTEVRALMFRLEDLKALGIIDPGPQRDAVAKTLTSPKVKITLHTAEGDQTVKLYQPDVESGEAIAETKPDAPLYRISPAAIKDLTKELFTLQDKRLLGVDYTDIAMLSVKTRDKEYVLINQNGEWLLEDRPTEKVSQQAADLFVSRVANLPAEERVIKQSAPLAPYGLTAPAAEFVATGKNGQVVGKLSLGNQAGNLLYATGARLQGIFQVRPDILTQIPSKEELLAEADEKKRG
ncbi:DUF4340 domain-containing protein [Nitrospira moscoviensis]|uniref:DUF4340 domain-containing protein n=1 Tax=Nitrospira moscoviensis TaxID=42253 RepID=A0A0K2G9H5_NITMO|nr:DUF4340 domain-containing protein [Nitrospira moscoviensis]ALA57603.1 hypothetical protein NITMOv2_1172 [Nitrospira moscoviensis]